MNHEDDGSARNLSCHFSVFFVARWFVISRQLHDSRTIRARWTFHNVPSAQRAYCVSALGLGGYHIAMAGSEREGIRIVHAAIDAGITFMDNAWEYHDGKSERDHGQGARRSARCVFLMTKVCTHGRDDARRCGSSNSRCAA